MTTQTSPQSPAVQPPTAQPPAPPGTVITFYSFKGGVGRTMSLANSAWILASQGYRVLVVDWDLEAPGLHRYFRPLLLDPELRSSEGVVDLIRGYCLAVRPGPPVPDRPAPLRAWLREYVDLDRYLIGVDLSLDTASADRPGAPYGRLDFLPAGRQDAGYSAAVMTFNWAHFYDDLHGSRFFAALREEFRARYDYVLVDSRTGFSDSAGICTVLLPDVVVDCFTLSVQGIEGAVAVAESIRDRARQRQVRVMPVPMRVESAEARKLQAVQDLARSRFHPFVAELGPEETDRYWGDVAIPYKPFFAYEEIPATVGERPHEANGLLAAAERLTARIVDRRGLELRPQPEADRRALLAAYEQIGAPVSTELLLSHAPADRLWAEWIGWQLRLAGYQVTLSGAAELAGSDALLEAQRTLQAGGRLVVLLSPDYLALPYATELWHSASVQDPGAAARRMLPVRIHDGPLPAPFGDLVAIDLAGQEEAAAVRVLRAGLGPRTPAGDTDGQGTVLVAPEDDTDPDGAEPQGGGPRYPGRKPQVWRVPTRNAQFTGRALVLEKLRSGFAAGGAPQTLFGIGGVGKTQVAIEYAHRHAADYDVVWFVSADQPGLVRQELAALAEPLGVTAGEDVAATAAAVQDALRRGHPYRRWLLVFDNAESPERLDEVLPEGTGHVLLTSRNPGWAERARQVEVGVFARAESLQLLRRLNPELAPADADRIADELGDLPLAVGQAGAMLQQSGIAASVYLDLLRTQMTQMLAEPIAGTAYPRSAAATWLLALDQLRAALPQAAELLMICAFLGAAPIPLVMLTSRRAGRVVALSGRGHAERLRMDTLLREINRYGLARSDRGDNTITVHRLIQQVLRGQADEEQQASLRSRAHQLLADANPGDPEDPGTWDRYAELLPHLAPSRAVTSEEDEVREWVVDTVRYLWRRSDHQVAESVAELAYQAWQPVSGDDDPLVLYLRSQWGNALRSSGHLLEAEELGRDVYRRSRAALGPNDPYTLIAASNRGADLRAIGAYAQAREVDEETYAVCRRVYDEDHPRTLMAANNLAVSLYLTGDRWRACELDRVTWENRRQSLGPRHPDTLMVASNYARGLRETGQPEQARRILSETVLQLRESLGDRHPYTLRAAQNLAAVLRRSGEYEQARGLNEDTYLLSREALGPQHPDTLSAATSLAVALVANGDAAGARALAEESLAYYRDRVGPHHPLTLASACNLSVYLRLTGALEEARGLSAETLDRFREVLGDHNPYTITAMIDHANDLAAAGRHEEAIALEREGLVGLAATVRLTHYDAIGCAANLAADLLAAGHEAEARATHQEALTRARAALGPDHPTTLAISSWTRLDSDIEPPAT